METLFLLVVILVLVDTSAGDPRAQKIQFDCSHELEQNKTNLVATMDKISYDIQSFGFGVATSGTGPDASYGLAQCYGDLSLMDCVSCYAEARYALKQCCYPYNGGRIFLDGCFMRLESYSFFQEVTGQLDKAVCGNKSMKDEKFEELVQYAVFQACTYAPDNFGSARIETFAVGNESAYVLADCWKSLSSNSCRECLVNASDSIMGCLPWSEGRALNTGCFIRYSDTNFLNSIPITLSRGSSAISRFPMAKPGCRNTCGNNVTIPYPFGIGSACALNEFYTIKCHMNDTSLFRQEHQVPFIKVKGEEYEVLQVSLMDQTITVTTPLDATICYGGYSVAAYKSLFNRHGGANLDGTPFLYAKELNRLTLLGCGNALLYLKNPTVKVLSGCTSTCLLNRIDTSSCFGSNCCQTDIPFNLQQYSINLTVTEHHSNGSNCVSAILADKKWNPEDDPYIPVVWSWTLQNASEINAISGCSSESRILELESGNITTFRCECKFFGPLTWYYNINPYLHGACNQARKALYGTRKKIMVAIISVSTGLGLLILITLVVISCKMLKKWRNKKLQEKFFKQNGGLLLQQQLSSYEGSAVDKTNIFNAKELTKASDGFNVNRVLGEGGQGTVYKGMLTDGRIVAIKKSKVVGERQLEQFINEVVVLSQVNHKNVVKVLGCCLETEVPLLVYEFIPNGTLYNLIHNEHDRESPLTWSTRLKIAREVASALAYLHTSISMPIFHKDIKSSNILLDEKYTAKVADFGTSRSVAVDKTHLTTRVQGTFGYIDPEYFQSSQFTDKSDVYSFGVVLIELLTGQKPISAGQGEDSDLGLARRFLECMGKVQKGVLRSTILDPQIVDDESDEDQVIAVAKLAQRCVDWNGRRRPTMKEVSLELESINMSKLCDTCTNQEKPPSDQSYIEEDFDHNTWTFGSETTVSSAAPHSMTLLSDTV